MQCFYTATATAAAGAIQTIVKQAKEVALRQARLLLGRVNGSGQVGLNHQGM